MSRPRPPFYDEIGHHSELMYTGTTSDALGLPWSLLNPRNCSDKDWPTHALPTITSQTPEDALDQMDMISERWGISGAHISIVAHQQFLDAEGTLEAARKLLYADYFPVLRSPLDWSIATRLSEMGCLAVDVQAVFNEREQTVSRPWLLAQIIQDSLSPILISGLLSVSESNLWLSKGATAIIREPSP